MRSEYQNLYQRHTLNTLSGEYYLSTGELKPYKPNQEMSSSTMINAKIDGSAKCPVFERYLSNMVRGSGFIGAKRDAILETISAAIMGNTRPPALSFGRFVWIYGTCRTGKTTMMHLIINLLRDDIFLGLANMVNIPAKNSQFELEHLIKTNLLMSDEIYGKIEPSYEPTILNIVVGNVIEIPRKHESDFILHNPNIMLLGFSNERPDVSGNTDISESLMSRILPIQLTNSYDDGDDDNIPDLLNKLIREKDAIFTKHLLPTIVKLHQTGRWSHDQD